MRNKVGPAQKPVQAIAALPDRVASKEARGVSIDRFERVRPELAVENAGEPIYRATAVRVARSIRADPVASRAYEQLLACGTRLVLDFGLGPSRLLGFADAATNRIKVYARNHRSDADIVATIVHESSHIVRAFRGADRTQLDEVRARHREFLYRYRRRPTLSERCAIRREVEELYADLRRR